MQIQHAIRSLRDVCAVKHLALNTEQSYTQWLRRYATFLKKEPPQSPATAEQKIERFLTSLAHSGVSASTQNQALNALLFSLGCLYRLCTDYKIHRLNSAL